MARRRRGATRDDVIALLRTWRPRTSSRKRTVLYSNTNYILAGLIVERATRNYNRWPILLKRIFSVSSEMNQTRFVQTHHRNREEPRLRIPDKSEANNVSGSKSRMPNYSLTGPYQSGNHGRGPDTSGTATLTRAMSEKVTSSIKCCARVRQMEALATDWGWSIS